MEVSYGNPGMIDAWMELVESVRRNFPGLEEEASMISHRNTVLRFMKEQRALCVKCGDRVIGVLLLSKKHNMICCLAVDKAYRGQGIATMLVKKALGELDRSRPATVTTFREDDGKGVAPRALYKKFGFREGKLGMEYGYPVQEFVLRESV